MEGQSQEPQPTPVSPPAEPKPNIPSTPTQHSGVRELIWNTIFSSSRAPLGNHLKTERSLWRKVPVSLIVCLAAGMFAGWKIGGWQNDKLKGKLEERKETIAHLENERNRIEQQASSEKLLHSQEVSKLTAEKDAARAQVIKLETTPVTLYSNLTGLIPAIASAASSLNPTNRELARIAGAVETLTNQLSAFKYLSDRPLLRFIINGVEIGNGYLDGEKQDEGPVIMLPMGMTNDSVDLMIGVENVGNVDADKVTLRLTTPHRGEGTNEFSAKYPLWGKTEFYQKQNNVVIFTPDTNTVFTYQFPLNITSHSVQPCYGITFHPRELSALDIVHRTWIVVDASAVNYPHCRYEFAICAIRAADGIQPFIRQRSWPYDFPKWGKWEK